MIEVEYWVLTPDGYDNRYMTVNTDDEQEAFDTVKETHRRSKNFKVYKKWDTKICSSCGENKILSEFYKHKKNKDGLRYFCKECNKSKTIKYQRTEKGLIYKIYEKQRVSSKKRKHNPPNYTKEELCEWVLSQDNFKNLYKNWVDSNYFTKLTPSIDRLDDYKPYTLNNIQVVTWEENLNKSYNDRKSGINNKGSKKVYQYSLEGDFIKEYYSVAEAFRQTEIRHISEVCNDIYKTTGGFKWSYEKQTSK
jgi:hypothetical protein